MHFISPLIPRVLACPSGKSEGGGYADISCLYSFTDQGMRNIDDTTKRADAFKALAESKGCKVREVFWTLGPYDMATICDVPDDATATAMVLALSKAGNVRTLTLRAFSKSEMDNILAKVG